MKKITFISTLLVALLTLTGQARAGLRLRDVMHGLEVRMEAIVQGISYGDFVSVDSYARAIAGHEKSSIEERQKILSFLKEDAGGFKEADSAVHRAAAKLSEAARKKDYNGVIKAYGLLLDGCVKCHNEYRTRIAKAFYGKKGKESRKSILMEEAASVVKEFGGRMKLQMKKAMSSGGPVEAIRVCSIMAPRIARRLGEQRGWKIKRVSLKPRNSKLAVPDEWEEKVLLSFDKRQRHGEAPAKMAYGEVVGGRFRFMKALGVEPLCLKCHGISLAPGVSKTLKELYPEDKATGYSPGEVRGAVSISRGFKMGR